MIVSMSSKSKPNGNLENDQKILEHTRTVSSTKPIKYEDFISTRSSRRRPTPLREIMTKFVKMTDPIALAGGMPNVLTFPFKKFSVELADGITFKLEGKDLATALLYLGTGGFGPLVDQLKQMMETLHGVRDWESRNLVIACGSSEPMTDVFEMVLNEGDAVVLPIPLFTGTIDTIRPLNLEKIGLVQDKHGPRPEDMRGILEQRVLQGKPLPKLVYINPIGCNPTGGSLTVARKRELYQVCCDYNMLILEDDPYYHLQFSNELEPSLLSMDVEGRVLRVDSFSKTLSAGLRLGWLTGPTRLVRQIEMHLQVSSMQTSSLSQVLVSKLLQQWGWDKYFAHVAKVKDFYSERRDIMVAACQRYLTGLAEWELPTGGFFLWLRVTALADVWDLVTKHCLEKKLLMVPGHPFFADLAGPECGHIRLCYSLASAQQMEEGIRLLADTIKDLMKVQTAKTKEQ